MAKLDLNLMAVLEAIYDEGTTSRAADVLHLSQSAVSHALKRLRGMYDDPLFVRQGHKMIPTPLTRRMIKTIKTSLVALRNTVDGAQVFEPHLHQQLFRMSQRDAVEAILLPPMMKILQAQAPGIRISSTQFAPDDIATQLQQGQIDVGMELHREMPKDIISHCLLSDGLAVVGRKGHPFFSGEQGAETFLQYSQVLVTPFQGESEWVDQALASLGLTRDVSLRCLNFNSGINVLLQTDKLSIMPKIYAETQTQWYPIASAEVPFAVPPLDLHMYWHERQHTDLASRWFRERIIDIFTEFALASEPRAQT
jgi:DNA-binding transcriptional LysR family regulator